MAFEARVYDPRVGIFLSRDPLSGSYPGQSPYAYAANNPIRLIDVLGMAAGDPPGWWKWARQNMPITHVFEKEYWGYVKDDLSRVGKDAGDAALTSALGNGNALIRFLSLGTINRSAEDIKLNPEFHDNYNKTSYNASVLLTAVNPSGGGPAPSLATSGGVQISLTTTRDLSVMVTATVLASTGVNKNREDGSAREEAEYKDLQSEYPDATVYRERYLRDANGKKVVDPLTGEGRRIDFAVVKDGLVKLLKEVTSMTANKTLQTAKEDRIRGIGGTFVKAPGKDGKLFNVKDIITQISRRE